MSFIISFFMKHLKIEISQTSIGVFGAYIILWQKTADHWHPSVRCMLQRFLVAPAILGAGRHVAGRTAHGGEEAAGAFHGAGGFQRDQVGKKICLNLFV